MRKRYLIAALLLLMGGVALAEDPPAEDPPAEKTEAKTDEKADDKAEATAPEESQERILGMSILGNQEAPKSLVIVPWRSSELGDAVGIQTMLDDSRQPIDREVFLRALHYYEIRSESKPQ